MIRKNLLTLFVAITVTMACHELFAQNKPVENAEQEESELKGKLFQKKEAKMNQTQNLSHIR